MIILITYKNPDDNNILYVSHGIDSETDKGVVLPDMPLYFFTDRKFDRDMVEWVIE